MQKTFDNIFVCCYDCMHDVRMRSKKTANENNKGEIGTTDYDEPVTIEFYSQISSYRGMLVGWYAQILKDKLNVRVNMVMESDVADEQSGEKLPGDIIVFGANAPFERAMDNGQLLNLSDTNAMKEYGAGILEQKNILRRDDNGDIYGLGTSNAGVYDYDEPFMTFDIRYDCYAQMGYPAIDTLDDLYEVLCGMHEEYSTDEQPLYASVFITEWDDSMDTELTFMPQLMVSAYYGYEKMGMGFYNDGEYEDALKINDDGSYGPYLQMVEFYNKLYRNRMLYLGRIDESITQAERGNVLWSPVNYIGSNVFNTDSNLSDGKAMLPVVPTEATPAVYGLSSFGRCVAINADTECAEECIRLLDYIFTPEGMLEMEYGPKGLCWDYDENGKTYLTDLGKKCEDNMSTVLASDDEQFAMFDNMKYRDGISQFNFVPYSMYAVNPDTGERYSDKYWSSERCKAEEGTIMADWQNHTGSDTVYQYMDNNVDLSVNISYELSGYCESDGYDEMGQTWRNVSDIIKEGSFAAVKAATEEEFEAAVEDMIAKAKAAGYNECVSWGIEQSEIRKECEERLLKQ